MLKEPIYQQQTLWPEGSLARTSASPESKPGSKRATAAACGLNSPVLLANFDPRSSSLKMYLPLLPMAERPCLSALPRYGMMQNGALWRLPMWERPTAGNGGSVWPTHRAQATRTSRSSLTAKHWSATSLSQMIELSEGILPREFSLIEELTPGARKIWQTSTVNDSKNNAAISQRDRHSEALNVQVAIWATPQAFDAKNIDRSPEALTRAKTKGGCKNLREEVQYPTPTANRWDGLQSHGVNVVSGLLNPSWVECLMGYPQGWTDIDGPPDQANNNIIGNPLEP